MASGRAHGVPDNRLLTPSDVNNDRMFPLSVTIDKACTINKTLPKPYAQNINPPFDVLRRKYYRNEHAADVGSSRLDDGRLMYSAGNGNPENAPRSFTREETWKIPTWHDMNYAFGNNEAIPVGMTQRNPNPPNIFPDEEDDEMVDFDDEYVSISGRLALEETLFDKITRNWEDQPDAQRTDARRFLESTQNTFVRFAGCTEEKIDRSPRGRYCCWATSELGSHWQYDPDQLKQRLFHRLHKRPWCAKNSPCHFLVNSLDVSAPTKDGKNLAHVFSIRFTHDPSLRDQVFDVLRGARADDLLNFDHSQQSLNPISEFDLGFMQVIKRKEKKMNE